MNPLVIAGMQIAKHSLMRFLSVLVWTLVIAGIGWAIYVMAIKPHTNPTPTESQQADNIVNYNYELSPKQTFFGCSNFKIPAAGKIEK